jgi:hypothetical protein
MALAPVANRNTEAATTPPPAAQKKAADQFSKVAQQARSNEAANTSGSDGQKTAVKLDQSKVQGRGERDQNQGDQNHPGKQTRLVNGVRVTTTDGHVTARVNIGNNDAKGAAGSQNAAMGMPEMKQATGAELRNLGQASPTAGNAVLTMPRLPEARTTRLGETAGKVSSDGSSATTSFLNTEAAIRGQQNGEGSSGGGGQQGKGDQGGDTPGGNNDEGPRTDDAGGTGGAGRPRSPVASGDGGGPVPPSGGGGLPPGPPVGPTPPSGPYIAPPKLATASSKSIGQLSIMFEKNTNSSLRSIIADTKQGLRFSAYGGNPGSKLTLASQVLWNSGFSAQQSLTNSRHLDVLAHTMNVDVTQLGQRIADKLQAQREIIAQYTPQNPLVINTRLKPSSIEPAIEYATALFSAGVTVPAHTQQIEGYDVECPAKLVLTASSQDVDGVSKWARPPMRGLDIEVLTRLGDVTTVHVPLPDDFEGTPNNVAGVLLTVPPQAKLHLTDGSTINVEISDKNALVLSTALNSSPKFVDGAGARFFPEGSQRFLKEVSATTIKGTINPGVGVNAVKFITFGGVGDTPFEGSPGNMTSNFGRGEPSETLTKPVPRGFHGAEGIRVSAGGATETHTSEGIILQFVGMTESEASGAKELVRRMPQFVNELCDKYGISDLARADWTALVPGYENPNFIIPDRAIEQLMDASAPNDRSGPLPTMQLEIEAWLNETISDCGLDQSHRLHHYPAAPGDQVLLYSEPGANFGVEWAVGGRGQKVIPSLNFLLTELKTDRGIDLMPELESIGGGLSGIRQLEFPEIDQFLSDVVRPLALLHQRGGNLEMALSESGIQLSELQTMSLPEIAETVRDLGVFSTSINRLEQEAAQSGVLFGNLFPAYVVCGDTIEELADGTRLGTDTSMVRVYEKLCEKAVLVMIDTMGGTPPRERQPFFSTVLNEQTGEVDVIPRKSPRSDGPNGEHAPTMYFANQAEFGAVFNAALLSQASIDDDKLLINPR